MLSLTVKHPKMFWLELTVRAIHSVFWSEIQIQGKTYPRIRYATTVTSNEPNNSRTFSRTIHFPIFRRDKNKISNPVSNSASLEEVP